MAQGNPPTPVLGDFEGSIHFPNGSKKYKIYNYQEFWMENNYYWEEHF